MPVTYRVALPEPLRRGSNRTCRAREELDKNGARAPASVESCAYRRNHNWTTRPGSQVRPPPHKESRLCTTTARTAAAEDRVLADPIARPRRPVRRLRHADRRARGLRLRRGALPGAGARASRPDGRRVRRAASSRAAASSAAISNLSEDFLARTLQGRTAADRAGPAAPLDPRGRRARARPAADRHGDQLEPLLARLSRRSPTAWSTTTRWTRRTDKYHVTGVGCASAVPLMRLAAPDAARAARTSTRWSWRPRA